MVLLTGDGDRPESAAGWPGAMALLGLDGSARPFPGTTAGLPAHAAGRRGSRPAAPDRAPSTGRWIAVLPADSAGGGASGAVVLSPVIPEDPPRAVAAYAPLLKRLRAGLAVDPALSALAEQALAVWARPGFESFVSLPRLRFTPFAHQLNAARTVLTRMRGRAILADEVGLGKTIEAGLVLSELYLRRLVERTLILVPAGLVEQWHEELDRKFALPCLVHGSPAWQAAADPWSAPVVIASLAAARRAPLREQVAGTAWDLLVVDEAHRLKNPQTASARLVKSLQARHVLLLTATPVENRLDDIFQLVNLVAPGHLGSPARFRARHAARAGGEAVRDLPALQRSLREVMVRHRRSEIALMLPRRLAETLRVSPGDDESELYALVSARVRAAAQDATPSQRLALRSLQRLAGSSPRALAASLRRAGWDDLAGRAEAIGLTEKLRSLLRVLSRRLGEGELAEERGAARAGGGIAVGGPAAAGGGRGGGIAVGGSAAVGGGTAVARLAATGAGPNAGGMAGSPGRANRGVPAPAGVPAAAPAPSAPQPLPQSPSAAPAKAVVFTAYRESLEYIAEAVADAGLQAVLYHGSLSRKEKDAAIRRFEDDAPLLLTTEAAGEGRNLQFCHVMINFDLPWNPMQIEQRLGRIHRIGQDRDVLLTNLVNRGTVEERILSVLESKIHLFELVVGELDMILGRVEEDFDFESFVFAAYVDSRDDAEFAERLDRFGDDLARMREGYLADRGRIDRLVGEQASS